MLEKRVKSRFSHRQVYVPPAETYADFCQPLLNALTVSDSEQPSAPMRAAWNAAVVVRSSRRRGASSVVLVSR